MKIKRKQRKFLKTNYLMKIHCFWKMRRHKQFVEKKQKRLVKTKIYTSIFSKSFWHASRIFKKKTKIVKKEKRKKKLKKRRVVEKDTKKWFMNTKNVLRYFHVVYILKKTFLKIEILRRWSWRFVDKSFWKRKNDRFNSKKILLSLHEKKHKRICQELRRLSTNQVTSSQIFWRTKKVFCIF